MAEARKISDMSDEEFWLAFREACLRLGGLADQLQEMKERYDEAGA